MKSHSLDLTKVGRLLNKLEKEIAYTEKDINGLWHKEPDLKKRKIKTLERLYKQRAELNTILEVSGRINEGKYTIGGEEDGEKSRRVE